MHLFRQDLLKKNLQIEPLQDVLNKTETSSAPTAVSMLSDAHFDGVRAMSTPVDPAKLNEKHGVHFASRNSEVVGDSLKDAAVYRSEIEDLTLKLKTVSFMFLYIYGSDYRIGDNIWHLHSLTFTHLAFTRPLLVLCFFVGIRSDTRCRSVA